MNNEREKLAAKGERDLERIVNGEASINDLRKEHGLAPIEGGDCLYIKAGKQSLKKERFDNN